MPLPCAVLHGYVAHVVAVVLEQHVQAELHQYSAERSAAVVGTLQALQAAAAARREQEQGRVLSEGARQRGTGAGRRGGRLGRDHRAGSWPACWGSGSGRRATSAGTRPSAAYFFR